MVREHDDALAVTGAAACAFGEGVKAAPVARRGRDARLATVGRRAEGLQVEPAGAGLECVVDAGPGPQRRGEVGGELAALLLAATLGGDALLHLLARLLDSQRLVEDDDAAIGEVVDEATRAEEAGVELLALQALAAQQQVELLPRATGCVALGGGLAACEGLPVAGGVVLVGELREHLAGGGDRDGLHRRQGALGGRDVGADALDRVARELDAVGERGAGRVDVDDAAASAGGAGDLGGGLEGVAQGGPASHELADADALADLQRMPAFEERGETGDALRQGRDGGYDHCGPRLRAVGQGREHSEASVAGFFIACLPLEGEELGGGVEEDGWGGAAGFAEEDLELLRVALGVLGAGRHDEHRGARTGGGKRCDDVGAGGVRRVEAGRGRRLGQRVERFLDGGKVQRQRKESPKHATYLRRQFTGNANGRVQPAAAPVRGDCSIGPSGAANGGGVGDRRVMYNDGQSVQEGHRWRPPDPQRLTATGRTVASWSRWGPTC